MTDIVERLRQLAALKTGAPIPDWLVDENNTWGVRLSALAQEAADTIERLRSLAGKADVGPSFADIAKDLPRRSTEPPDPS